LVRGADPDGYRDLVGFARVPFEGCRVKAIGTG
jgi:hypothetical protein